MKENKKHQSDNLNFAEFVQYMIDHENRLELVFNNIDTDKNSKIFLLIRYSICFFKQNFNLKSRFLDKIGNDELVGYFKKLGVDISSNEADKLVSK